MLSADDSATQEGMNGACLAMNQKTKNEHDYNTLITYTQVSGPSYHRGWKRKGWAGIKWQGRGRASSLHTIS